MIVNCVSHTARLQRTLVRDPGHHRQDDLARYQHGNSGNSGVPLHGTPVP
jgi:hypothetical protein